MKKTLLTVVTALCFATPALAGKSLLVLDEDAEMYRPSDCMKIETLREPVLRTPDADTVAVLYKYRITNGCEQRYRGVFRVQVAFNGYHHTEARGEHLLDLAPGETIAVGDFMDRRGLGDFLNLKLTVVAGLQAPGYDMFFGIDGGIW